MVVFKNQVLAGLTLEYFMLTYNVFVNIFLCSMFGPKSFYKIVFIPPLYKSTYLKLIRFSTACVSFIVLKYANK